jgi:nitrite reductase/ring-hydroxylating ferredoxin subunit
MATCKECSKPATYAFKQKELLYCTKHGKIHGAKSFKQICMCGNAMPNFGLKDDEYPSGCSKCKTDDMIDIRHKRCKDCSKRPSYGVKGTTKVEYCADHKKEGMIDIKSNRCIHKDCTKQPSFNTEGKKALYCSLHKKEGMFNIISKKWQKNLPFLYTMFCSYGR